MKLKIGTKELFGNAVDKQSIEESLKILGFDPEDLHPLFVAACITDKQIRANLMRKIEEIEICLQHDIREVEDQMRDEHSILGAEISQLRRRLDKYEKK